MLSTAGGIGTRVLDINAILQRHGLDWERLDKLAWKALNDAKRQRRIVLDVYRDERAHDYLFDIAVRWARRYDPAQANGVSFATSAYRRMVQRLPDYLRDEHGDDRIAPPLHTTPVAEMPDGATMDEETFEQAVEAISAGLSTRALWTLRHLARRIVVEGITVGEAAKAYGLTFDEALEYFEELGWRLGHTPANQEAKTVSVYQLEAA